MAKPLDEIEMIELLWAAYPERFSEETDLHGEAALLFADQIEGFDALAELLGRVVMLTMPMTSEISGTAMHALGKIEIAGRGMMRSAQMTAAVKREVAA